MVTSIVMETTKMKIVLKMSRIFYICLAVLCSPIIVFTYYASLETAKDVFIVFWGVIGFLVFVGCFIVVMDEIGEKWRIF